MTGLTDAVADREAVLLGVKVIPVAAAAAVDKLGTAALLAVKVPAGQHGTARTGLRAGQTHLWDAHTRAQTGRHTPVATWESYRAYTWVSVDANRCEPMG